MGRVGGAGVGRLVLVDEELDGAGRVGQIVLLGDDPERPRAAREDVHAPVVHALEHLGDLHRAADRPLPVVAGPDDSELRAALEALPDHRAVALLEDVQGNDLVGQGHDAEGEQREVADDLVGHRVSLRRTYPCG